MKTYGYASHEAKPESYEEYKEKRFKVRQRETIDIVENINNSSLTPEDKLILLRSLVDIINQEIYERVPRTYPN